MFVTSEGHPGAVFQRAVRAGDVTAAETILLDMRWVPLDYARAVLELYAEKGHPKYERAALKYLRRYMDEADAPLLDVAQLAGILAARLASIQGR